MKAKPLSLLFVLPLAVLPLPGATRYVNLNNSSPQFPYDTFPKAAVVIQDAVDAAEAGDLIMVTNGLYQSGGHAVYGATTSRVAITKALELRSVNGPTVTTIQGYQVPWTTNGAGAVRCVYMTNGAILSGFTLTNGAVEAEAIDGGRGSGVWCESVDSTVTNCILTANSAEQAAYRGTFNNSILTGNFGHGASFANLNNCSVLSNYAGGTVSSTLDNCILAGNRGTGAKGGILSNCVLSGNGNHWDYQWYAFGGGASGAVLTNCVLTGNMARFGYGGGAYRCSLYNCVLRGNSAVWDGSDEIYGGGHGGGAYESLLYNCTVVGNSSRFGGGTYYSTLWNCIVYYNTGANDFPRPSPYPWMPRTNLIYCCTTPMPLGSGNITNEPRFVSLASGDLHLRFNSPCINAGTNAAAPGPVDLGGNLRILDGIVDMGAYEGAVAVPPEFLDPQLPGPEGMTLTLDADLGVVEIHASQNLTAWSWLVTLTNSGGQLIYLDPAATNQPRRFYRALQTK